MQRETTPRKTGQYRKRTATVMLAVVGAMSLCWSIVPTAHGESLFRASATQNASAPFTPRSLYTQPRPNRVGDIVTVTINEQTQQQVTSNLKISRNQQIDENGTSLTNNAVRFMLNKLPILKNSTTNKIADVLSLPSFSGMDNSNALNSKAESSRNNKLTESITCEVVQVLPNGALMIQGRKSTMMNKERQDLVLTGIVDPYYIDRNNQIASTKVANLQFMLGGTGVISRQQNDGIVNKIYQFFN
jgi:flagellar L-ring protein precursor FlgH